MVNPLPKDVTNMLALREHRMHHFIWHAVRDGWERFEDEDKAKLTARGWMPPRPSLDKDENVNLSNKSGEDFLFMHRQMIKHVNDLLSQLQDPTYPKVIGWNPIPSPQSSDYPVPPYWEGAPFESEIKTDDYYAQVIKPMENRFTDLSYLSQISLGELGARLEYSIHAIMHLRWSSQPLLGMRPDLSPVDSNTIETRWDHPGYDFLADFYSSHVNPNFWKLHGWIDNRIEDWKLAHQISEVPWSVQWEKNLMPHHKIVHSNGRLIVLQDANSASLIEETMEVAKIIAKTKILPSVRVLLNMIQ